MSGSLHRVVVIDDEFAITDMLSRYLSALPGLRVDTFTDPEEGCRSILEDGADVVLLDVMMPKMSGLEVMEQVMVLENPPEVILMTAFSAYDRLLDPDIVLPDIVLRKPFSSMKEVEVSVLKILEGKTQRFSD